MPTRRSGDSTGPHHAGIGFPARFHLAVRPSVFREKLFKQTESLLLKEYVMTAIEAQLIERLKKLPPSRVAEVVDFVEFLASREERTAAAQRLTERLGARNKT